MRWEQLNSPQIDKLDRNLPVVIPLGSIEQHGRHLPLNVDTVQVTAVADAAEAQLRDEALFLAPLWLGSSHHHLGFPGTVSVRPSLYSQVISDVVMSVLIAGFNRLFLLNGHGGNEVPASQALAELAATNERAQRAYLTMASWWHIRPASIAPEHVGMETNSISHACEYETSLMLHLRPDLVDQAAARSAPLGPGSDYFAGVYRPGVQLFQHFRQMTATGSLGQPEKASADKGKALLDAVVSNVVGYVRELASWPTPGAGESPRQSLRK